MKTIVKKMLLPAGICLTVLLIGCLHNNGLKPDASTQLPIGGSTSAAPLTPQQTLEAEVDTVTLEVPNKPAITAGELKQENILASGYDASYAIKLKQSKPIRLHKIQL